MSTLPGRVRTVRVLASATSAIQARHFPQSQNLYSSSFMGRAMADRSNTGSTATTPAFTATLQEPSTTKSKAGVLDESSERPTTASTHSFTAHTHAVDVIPARRTQRTAFINYETTQQEREHYPCCMYRLRATYVSVSSRISSFAAEGVVGGPGRAIDDRRAAM